MSDIQNKSAAQVVDDDDDDNYKKEGICTKLCSKIFGGKGDIQTVVDLKDIDKSKAIKIIVLGPGNSGKSTVLKQMRIIHGSNYNESDRKKFKPLVVQNLLDAVVRLVKAMKEVFRQNFEDDSNEGHYNLLLSLFEEIEVSSNNLDRWNQDTASYVKAVQSIWRDFSIKLAYANRNKFFLSDSAEYFINSAERIGNSNYIPNIDDVLRARQATTDIKEYTFNMKGTVFSFTDVGGQRSERRKWINVFQNVTSMLYVTSLADYDLNMSSSELKNSNGSGEINRMKDSYDLFNTIINWSFKNQDSGNEGTTMKKLFANISVILFFNKEDLFEEKFENSSPSVCFPDYDHDLYIDEAKEFIANKFVSCAKERNDIYYHYTFALDTKNVQAVIGVVRDTIIKGLAKNVNLF